MEPSVISQRGLYHYILNLKRKILRWQCHVTCSASSKELFRHIKWHTRENIFNPRRTFPYLVYILFHPSRASVSCLECTVLSPVWSTVSLVFTLHLIDKIWAALSCEFFCAYRFHCSVSFAIHSSLILRTLFSSLSVYLHAYFVHRESDENDGKVIWVMTRAVQMK